MAKTVTIDKNKVLSRIKVHLSIIGKRLNQKPGDKNYQNITLTTNEDTLIDDYFTGAVAYLAGEFPDVLISYASTGSQGYDGEARSNEAQNSALQDIYSSYILSYCIASYLAMVNSELAKKYQQEAVSYLLSARNIIYTKTKPSYDGDYLSPASAKIND